MSVNAGTVAAYLTLDTNKYTSSLHTASLQMRTFLDDTADGNQRIASLGDALTTVGSTLIKGVTLPLVGAGSLITLTSAKFENAMSEVMAISGATGAEFTALRDKAMELGEATRFNATEAANGMTNLASAGFQTNEIIAAMPGLLDLAVSGNVDLASASEITAGTLRGFNLDAEETSRVADILAKAAADTNAGITDTGEAMKYVAPVASAMGHSIEEVTAAIGLLSNANIKGGQAGTVLRSALARLSSPSKESAGMMKELGFNVYDNSGKMLSLSGIIANLEKSMSGLTEQERQYAVTTIFGQEAMSGMLTLMAAGPEQMDTLTQSLTNADGAASKMAEVMGDNLQGQITELKSKLEGVSITLGETLLPIISNGVGTIKTAVDAFSELDEGTQGLIVKSGLIVAAAGPLLTAGGNLVSGCGTLVTAIETVGVAVYSVTGPVGILIGIVGVGAVMAWRAYVQAQEEARQAMINFGTRLEELVTKVKNADKRMVDVESLISERASLVTSIETQSLTTDELTAANERLDVIESQLMDNSDGMITKYDLEYGRINNLLPLLEEKLTLDKEMAMLELQKEVGMFNLDDLNAEIERLKIERDTSRDTYEQLINDRNALMMMEADRIKILNDVTKSTKEQEDAVYDLMQTYIKLYPIMDNIDLAKFDLNSHINKLNNDLDKSQTQFEQMNTDYNNAIATQQKYNMYIRLCADGTIELISATDDLSPAMQKTTDAFTESITALRTQTAALNDSSGAINEVLGDTDNLQSAYETLASKQELSADTLLELITKYPQLAKYIAETSDFTFQHGEVLKSVAQTSRETAIQNAQDEIDKTNATIEGARQRIGALQAEITVMQSVYAMSGSDTDIKNHLEQQQQRKSDAEAQLKAAEEALAVTEASLKVLERSNEFHVKATKEKKEENKALKEALKIFENRIELEDLSTAAIIAGYEEIKAAYARTQDEIIDIDKKVKRQREQLLKEELSDLEKAAAASKDIFTGEMDYSHTVAALELMLDRYREYPVLIEQINEKLVDAQQKLSDQNAQMKLNEIETIIDGINREIDLRKELDCVVQGNGETYRYTTDSQIGDITRLMSANQQLVDYLQAQGDTLTEQQAKTLADRLKLQQEYHDRVRSLYIAEAKAYQQAQQEIAKLEESYATDRHKLQTDLSTKTLDTQRKLNADLVKLNEDYEKKVADVHKKLADSERSLTEAYETELTRRAKSITNFTGLFAEVVAKDVSGEQLLNNLRGQLDTIKDWQKNLDELAQRGLDENLLAELTGMDPSSASELAALNSLTDEMLDEYIAIYREKSALARVEAESQMETQRRELTENLANLRVDASNELTALANELQRQTESIRASAQETLSGYVDDWRKKLTELNKTFDEKMSELRETSDAALDGLGVLNEDEAAAAIEAILADDSRLVDERLALYGLDADSWAGSEAEKTSISADEIAIRTTNLTSFNKDKKTLYGKDAADHANVEGQKTTDVRTNLNIQKAAVWQVQADNIATLKSFIPDWYSVGQTYGDMLLDGIKGTQLQIMTYLDGIISTVKAAASAQASAAQSATVGMNGYASGTNNAARGLAVVGKYGMPELVDSTGGEQVVNFQETMELLNYAASSASHYSDALVSGFSQNYTEPAEIDYDRLGKAVAAALGDKIKPSVSYSPTYHSPKPASIAEQKQIDKRMLYRLGLFRG